MSTQTQDNSKTREDLVRNLFVALIGALAGAFFSRWLSKDPSPSIAVQSHSEPVSHIFAFGADTLSTIVTLIVILIVLYIIYIFVKLVNLGDLHDLWDIFG